MLNRRHLFGAVPAIAVAAVPFAAQAAPLTVASVAPMQSIASLWGERGRAAALHALAAGMDLTDITTVVNLGATYTNHPSLIFGGREGKPRVFGPIGEVL